MRDNRLKSTILYNLKKNQSMPLDDLMEISTGFRKFQDNTGDAIFFEIIIDLFKARFIKVSDNETNEYLKRYKGRTNSFSDGYDFANYLNIGKQKTLYITFPLKLLSTFLEFKM